MESTSVNINFYLLYYHYSQHLTLLFLLLVRVSVLDVLPCFAFTATLSDNHNIMVVCMMERYPYITYHLALTVACTCCWVQP